MKRGAFSEVSILEPNGNGGGFHAQEMMGRQDLNYFCLYFDKLVVPANNLIYMGIDGEEEFIKEGFLSRPFYSYQSIPDAQGNYDLFTKIQDHSLRELEKTQKSFDWYVNNLGDSPVVDDNEIQSPTMRMELMKALPVPLAGVAVKDILEFRHRRRDELERIHIIIYNLYKEIRNSADPKIERAMAFSELEKALDDLNRTFYERWKEALPFTVSVNKEITAGDLYAAYKVEQAAYLAANGHMSAALIHCSMAAIPSVLSRITFKNRNQGKTDMKYLSRASKSGIIKI